MGSVFKKSKLCHAVFISFFVLIGCSGFRQPVHPIEYYTLEYDPPEVKKAVTLPLILRVEKFQVSPEYNTNSIIYRETPMKRNAYAYHKWRANPSDLVTYFIARDLDYSSLFTAVVTLNTRLIPTHTLEGIVDEFFENDRENSWYAVLGLRISLLKNNSPESVSQVLFQKKYLRSEKCTAKNPQALAEAMSRNMAAISGQIISDLADELRGRFNS